MKQMQKQMNSYLTNGEIWGALPALQQLMTQKLHVRTSMDLAKLAVKMKPTLEALDQVRKGIIQKYHEKDEQTGRMEIKPGTDAMNKFLEEWAEALAQPSEVKQPARIKLPETVGAVCDKCKHNMDRPLEIEGSVLVVLEKFVEVA